MDNAYSYDPERFHEYGLRFKYDDGTEAEWRFHYEQRHRLTPDEVGRLVASFATAVTKIATRPLTLVQQGET